MRKSSIATVAIILGFALANIASAQSADQQRELPLISETTCRDMLLAPGDEEDDIMIFFHGYVSGVRGQDVVDLDAFSAASQAVAEACVDTPSASLLDVFLAKR